MDRSLEWKQNRAFLTLSQVSQELRETCIEIARNNSPSSSMNRGREAAFLDGIFDVMLKEAVGKATRWLSVICRDHGIETFEQVVRELMLPRTYVCTQYEIGSYLGQLKSGQAVFDRANSHRHEGVTVQLLSAAFDKISLDQPGRHSIEINFGRDIGVTTCVPTTKDDEIVFAQRPGRKGLTRFVKNRQSIPTSILTVVLQKADEGDFYILVTVFIGFAIGAEPWDTFAKEKSKANWQTHALLWGSEEIVPGTETTDVPSYFI